MTQQETWRALAGRLRAEVLEPIKQRLIGKDEIVEVLGVALTAGENAFLLGPPGTGKSALVQELGQRLDGRTFDYLLTRFTEPSELFGPFDLRRLRDGDLVTNTEGMLPEADFVFLDELLNANSAILNSLLLALNERVFRRGRQTLALPMLLTVGASNRLPEDDALAALFDRFLLRVVCDNVEDQRLSEVLAAGWTREQQELPPASLHVDDIRQLRQAVTAVDLTTVLPAYQELVLRLRQAGMAISDRRAVRLQRVIAASAVICGRVAAELSDLWIVRYVWDTPPQQEVLIAHVEAVTQQFQEKLPADGPAHPLANLSQPPSAEQLQQQLQEIEADIQSTESRAVGLDKLGLLTARIEWVREAEARTHLRSQVTRLRELL
ncbi:AAA family ATPase [Roseimaritima ulvae]|uniref:ATPase RavA n=1 Tax=Roseimaritima ulvae TaxID=980254 RepID=A0A5B9QQ77_9BACT|nr:AAA family ATPase [Roseimaritima ulvae]QEG39810.1 ATPase RavA [Roseimaritima ulvae]